MYCSQCGNKTSNIIPEGDNMPREICMECGFIHYVNPKIIVVPILRNVEETIAGIISKKQNGLKIPPVK